MSRHWRCTQCGTFHGATSRFQDEPEECRECKSSAFETLGDGKKRGGFSLHRSLNLDAFTWMAMGMAIYNVIFALLGGFANSRALMYSAGISFVMMLLVAYTLSSRTMPAWVFSVVAFVGVTIWGIVIVGTRFLDFMEVEPIPIPVYGADNIFLAYGFIYLLLGIAGLAMLAGGLSEVKGRMETSDDISRYSG